MSGFIRYAINIPIKNGESIPMRLLIKLKVSDQFQIAFIKNIEMVRVSITYKLIVKYFLFFSNLF